MAAEFGGPQIVSSSSASESKGEVTGGEIGSWGGVSKMRDAARLVVSWSLPVAYITCLLSIRYGIYRLWVLDSVGGQILFTVPTAQSGESNRKNPRKDRAVSNFFPF